MSPQHLMPGNYILYKGKEVIVTPQLLISMHTPCRLKLFSPIELTEQWLIDFKEFERIDYYQRKIYKHNVFRAIKIEIDIPELVSCVYFNDEPINYKKYVHQLQILYFALTQKQLTK